MTQTQITPAYKYAAKNRSNNKSYKEISFRIIKLTSNGEETVLRITDLSENEVSLKVVCEKVCAALESKAIGINELPKVIRRNVIEKLVA